MTPIFVPTLSPVCFHRSSTGLTFAIFSGFTATVLFWRYLRDNPTVYSFMPSEEAWASYNRLPVNILADDLEAQANRMGTIFADVRPSDWTRPVFRDGTEREVAHFTVVGLVAYSVHEAHHHLLDAKGTGMKGQ
jgi:hypothetical protein